MHIFVKAIIVILFIAIVINVTYFIFGFFPFVRAKSLKEEDVEEIRKYGLIHKTTCKGRKGIENEKMIKGHAGRKAYSTHFKKSAFFFAESYVISGEDFNQNLKYKYVIKIINLSDEQIRRLRIRDYDKSLIYLGDFAFEEKNKVSYTKISKEKNSKYKEKIDFVCGIKKMKKDKYTACLILSTIISFLLFWCIYQLIIQVM